MPRVVRGAVLMILSVFWLVPLYLIVLNALKSNDAIVASPFGISHLTLGPLRSAVESPTFNVLRGYLVTGLIVVLVNAGSVAICAPAAYVLARHTTRISNAMLIFLFSGAFIPAVVLIIPQVYVLRQLGLLGGLLGLVLTFVSLTVPISMFAYVPYIRSLPKELDEAAAIDGAGTFRVFRSIIFPLMRPALITVVLLNTTAVWENFIQPFIILGPASDYKTVTTAIYGAVGPYQTDYSVVYPNLLLVIAPLMVFYLLLQRHLVGGLGGAMKG